METERKRIKRAEVSEDTRSGRKRAAVNPHARKASGSADAEGGRAGGRSDAGRGGEAS